ncbi:leucine-rich repeat domain-containing protein [Candidatus Uhrbacteria bacterium]|nr:leucine-rich repeat domain-containing protein [Candidatus Uhrbacteria bacterium]
MKHIIAFCLSIAILGAGCSTDATSLSGPSAVQKKPASGTMLDLSGRGLTSIPMDVFSRSELTGLDLSDNLLTGAPQSQIGQLKNLKTLDLSNNSLTGLPAELGQLDKLETLDVSNNQLTGLPMELGNLTQLRVLDITGNKYSARDLDEIAKKLTATEIRR